MILFCLRRNFYHRLPYSIRKPRRSCYHCLTQQKSSTHDHLVQSLVSSKWCCCREILSCTLPCQANVPKNLGHCFWRSLSSRHPHFRCLIWVEIIYRPGGFKIWIPSYMDQNFTSGQFFC